MNIREKILNCIESNARLSYQDIATMIDDSVENVENENRANAK